MRMPDSETEVELRHLTAVRTCGIKGQPGIVVLQVTADRQDFHFALRVEDLAALGRRLTLDAKLMSPPADLTERIDRAGGY